ncbi:MAG TPA: glycosyltransferase family 2 protein [Bacteroidales bacterium]|nr:glycosyltransferase family 2 protein [Bacteroidales bacterium]
MKPLISIITITYQAEDVLRRTVESILAQDFSDFEYLIVDGLSTDGTLAIIKEYQLIFKERGIAFRWSSERDHGIYDAMNKAMHLAEGDYLWFMNAGDKIASPTTLNSIWKGLSLGSEGAKNVLPDFIYGETLIVDDFGKIMGKRRLKAPEKLNWKSFRKGMLVCHQSMLVKRDLAPDYDLTYRYSGDFDWTIRCLRSAQFIYNTHLELAHFLDGGISKKKMRNSLGERFRIMTKNYGLISTTLYHFWFVIRAVIFKLKHGWI